MSASALTALAILVAVLLGLALLVGALAVAVTLAERSRVTVRKWLAVAWLATLVVPTVVTLATIAVATLLTTLPVGSFFRLSPPLATGIEIAVAPCAFVVTFVVIGWLTGRMVLAPLAAMGSAARQIAAGDLEISLPTPMLAEVADVAEAFRSMSQGLRTSIAEQAEAEQQRRLFISAVAHDLRTPLFALRGYLDGLRSGIAATSEKRAHYLAICHEQAETLERRVANLFTYSRLEYLGERPRVTAVDLAALLCRVVEGMRPLALERGIALTLDVPTWPCAVSADEHLLRRAVENLVENALRYTPTGGSVVVRAEQVGSWYAFSVEDTGPGIASRDLPHIFSPLYRGESSRNRETGGAGLGLAVARTILRRVGGDLCAANREEGGALFSVTLPAARDALPLPRSEAS